MKILCVLDNSIGTAYLRKALDQIKPDEAEVTQIKLGDYPALDDRGYDALIYNTFPDEAHPRKFRKDLVARTDEKMNHFRGECLWFDSHDDGLKDAFLRFNMPTFPRIKVTPGCGTLNVRIPITFGINEAFLHPEAERKIPLLYCARLDGYATDLRRQIFDRLAPFKPFTGRMSLDVYASHLASAQIAVAAPGWGTATLSHLEILASGALLLAHESIADVKLLPFADLVDGKNYLSFNLGNLTERLESLINHPKDAEKIRKAGTRSFKQGYNPRRTAVQILKYFEEEM